MMSPHEKLALIALLEKMPTTTPCTACTYYDTGFCRSAEAKIPDDVLEVGCELFKFDPNSPPF